eukprot:scaffold535_cov260-Pinguiococcus_pyrenoidosus.AAC.37
MRRSSYRNRCWGRSCRCVNRPVASSRAYSAGAASIHRSASAASKAAPPVCRDPISLASKGRKKENGRYPLLPRREAGCR